MHIRLPDIWSCFHTRTRGVRSIFCLTSWPWDHDSPAPSKARSGQSTLTVSLLAGFHSTQADLELLTLSPPRMAGVRASSWEAWVRMDLFCQFPELLGEPGDVTPLPQGEVAL